DFHEWSSENVRWNAKTGRHVPYADLWKRALKYLERLCLRQASEIITVGYEIARELETGYGESRPVPVIRKIPALRALPTRTYPALKEQLGLPPDSFVVLWQGGTGPTRHIEPIIESLRYVNDVVLVIRGPSLDLFGEGYRAVARSAGVADRLVLVPPVPSRGVVGASRRAGARIRSLPGAGQELTSAAP